MRLAASITTHAVAPSTILKRLSASSKSSEFAKALRERGGIERTLFMIERYSSALLLRRCQAGLNKGEAAHKLKRAVFFHKRGEIRDRSFDSQAFRASGLNLVVSAIVHWNTVYLSRAATHLRQLGRNLPGDLLKRVSPQSGSTSISPASISGTPSSKCRKASDHCDISAVFSGPHDVHRTRGVSAGF